MTFVHPFWLYVGGASCAALALAMLWAGHRRTRALQRFVADRHAGRLIASLSRGRRRVKELLLLLGLALLFVALARPQWGYHWEEARREGLCVLRLETGALQPEAIGLYRSAGFVARGPFGDYADSAISVFMEKAL